MLNEFREKIYNEYEQKRQKSKELNRMANNYLPGGDTRTATYYRPYPHYIERGEGCFIWDVDGNKMIDFQNNYTSLIHGHAHADTVKAVCAQIAIGSNYSAPTFSQISLAKNICERVPAIDLIRFTNSGTEATMHAVRGARAYTNKTKIVKVEGGYHGTSDVFEASVDPDLKKAGTLNKLRPVPDSKGVPQSAMDEVLVIPFNNIQSCKKVIEENHSEISALIIEPVMGSAGMIEPELDYLKFLRYITEKYNILLIFDEVVTLRLAYGGAQEYYDIYPDITVLGKIIGGGLPIGAFGGKAEIMEMYDPLKREMYHSGTFNGNALAMVAGVATMDALTKVEIDRINKLGAMFREGCADTFRMLGLNITINGIGSLNNIIFSCENISEYRGVANSYEEFNILLSLLLIEKGIFNAPRGMFCMSTAMTKDEIQQAISAIKEGLTELLPLIKEQAPELLL